MSRRQGTYALLFAAALASWWAAFWLGLALQWLLVPAVVLALAALAGTDGQDRASWRLGRQGVLAGFAAAAVVVGFAAPLVMPLAMAAVAGLAGWLWRMSKQRGLAVRVLAAVTLACGALFLGAAVLSHTPLQDAVEPLPIVVALAGPLAMAIWAYLLGRDLLGADAPPQEAAPKAAPVVRV